MESKEGTIEIRDTVRELAGYWKQQAATLERQAQEAKGELRTWEDLASFLNKNWIFHILHFYQSSKNQVDKLRHTNLSSATSLDAHRMSIEKACDELRLRYPSSLEQACLKNELKIESESRHPKYLFEGGFFRVEIDERKGTAILSDNEGELAKIPADIDAVVELVKRERARVFERPFDGKRFLQRLRNQYLQVLAKQNQQDGASLPIRNITRRLGKNVKQFRTDEFLIDLSRLVDEGPLEIDGMRLDLQQTKDTSQGMLLHGIGGRGYIGFLLFKRSQP